ncbi:MAG: hypothetical protein Q4Q17_04700 [Tissierellia bacterium]|nr:hypothetical protein [Tissierellia bacterium]
MSKDRTFSLPKRKYKAFDVLRISYQIAPLQSIMLLCITILEGIIPTSILAMSTAYFVDTALSIFNGTQAYSEIYLPLLLLILLMGILNVLESMYLVVEAKIKCMLEGTLLPAIIEVQARLKYAYIEDPRSQEMIEITSDEMEQTFLEGLQAYVAILRSSIGIGSIIMLLMTQMWWVALLITFCSIPLLWVSLWAGKKNYEAKVDTRKYERRYSYYSDDILCGREAVQERTLFGYAEEMTDRYYENFKKASNIQLRVLLKTRLATKATSIALLVITMITALTLITPVLSRKVTPGMFMGIVAALVGMAKTLGWQLQDATKNIAESKEYMEGLTQLLAMETLRGPRIFLKKIPWNSRKLNSKMSYFNIQIVNTKCLMEFPSSWKKENTMHL